MLNILPLPLENKPKNFSGAVGRFKLNATLEPSKVKVNEPITLKLKLSGSGNIKLLNPPDINIPAGFEKYDPKTSEKINKGKIISGSKEIEYLIIPRIAGIKKIKPVEFSYFDLAKKKYVTLKTPEFKVRIEKGDNQFVNTPISGFSKEDVQLLSKDIRYIKTSNVELIKREKLSSIWDWYWYFIIIPIVIFVASIFFTKKRERLLKDTRLLKFKKAEKIAKQRLKLANKFYDLNDTEKFYSEISNALSGYLEDKFNIKRIEFSIEKVLEILIQKKIENEICENVKTILEKCEMARFAPLNNEAQKDLLDKTFKTIVGIESSIKGK